MMTPSDNATAASPSPTTLSRGESAALDDPAVESELKDLDPEEFTE
jgi:hypothetical protein